MTRHTTRRLAARLCRWALAAALLSSLASACAGRSISNATDGDDAGSAGRGTSGSAGRGTAGSAAGKSHAGTSSGGSTAGGNTGVAGGAMGGAAGFISVGGSSNPPDISSCNIAADCVLQSATGCCSICDSPDLAAQSLIAVNSAYAIAPCSLTAKILPLPIGGTGAGVPNPCASCDQPTASGTLHNFFANCVMNRCVVEDVRRSTVSSCMSDSDCMLRYGTACCQGCRDQDLVAVRNDGSFEKIACSAGPQPCPHCAPLPTTARAVCALGQCAVQP